MANALIDPTSIIFHYHGADTSSWLGESIQALGDINNDGYDDIAIGSRSPNGTYIFYGGDPVDTIPDLFIPGFNDCRPPIDFDGDGINDLAIATVDWISNSRGCDKGSIAFYKGFPDSVSSTPYDSLTPDSLCQGFGFLVRTGYFDTDSLGDLFSYYHHVFGGEILVYYSGCPAIDKLPDWIFQIHDNSHAFQGFDIIDFNGDGMNDLSVGMLEDTDSSSYIYIFYGPVLGSEPDIIIEKPDFIQGDGLLYFPRNNRNIRDFNGDGWDDLGVVYVQSGLYTLVYYCGPSADTLYDIKLEESAESIASSGDVNGDGYNDIVCGGIGGFSGMVHVYLGGQVADNKSDLTITEDDLPPLFLQKIGWQVSSAGDFNGDDYDDFMFSCQNFWDGDPGDVFIIAGSDEITTDIENGTQLNILPQVELKQNYPNPFNPSTIIEFTLPRAGFTEIRIYNLLGELVASPLSEFLPAGNHQVKWDGLDKNANQSATGIYFYQITSGDFCQTRQMILLK